MSRYMLVVSHTGREEALEASRLVIRTLAQHDVTPVADASQHAALRAGLGVELAQLGDVALAEIELGIVLGGDGTILFAAELLRGSGAPLLGGKPRARGIPRRE